ncbi:hypothetical protein D187_002717 [Cystobacter fuscus DSM 2262]|uniref:DUF2079 domain-containing protein n=1 Tax=Cystobacter fuscus (strain ATCC 25194 / DSM 2262 / NBRC 100088 / M29) TaxID=1242864 RepID=S9P8W3_CYSF2|nr:hypothetical protein D187_002717 [Cystobacter fuscus DSM 2262]
MLGPPSGGGLFAFHDLALLNDLFANAVHRGRPFWVTDGDFNHLTVHFTPSLLLLAPFFLLTDSQFLLVFLGLVALYGSLALHVWFFERMLEERQLLSAPWRPWACAAFAVYLALNPYTKTVALSAHFEVFFQLASTAVLVLLLRGVRMRWVVLLTLVALGVRPDGGLFLAFQAAALLLLPAVARPPREQLSRRVASVSVLSLGYLAFCVVVLLPALGTPPGTRFWSHYGDTWGQVALTALSDPARVVHDVASSGLVSFQRSFLWIQLLAPAATLVSSIPGTFFFMADAQDKRLLWFYNSAFLLPGLGVCAAAGFGRLAEGWRGWVARGRVPARALAAPALLLAGLALIQLVRFDRTVGIVRLRPLHPWTRTSARPSRVTSRSVPRGGWWRRTSARASSSPTATTASSSTTTRGPRSCSFPSTSRHCCSGPPRGRNSSRRSWAIPGSKKFRATEPSVCSSGRMRGVAAPERGTVASCQGSSGSGADPSDSDDFDPCAPRCAWNSGSGTRRFIRAWRVGTPLDEERLHLLFHIRDKNRNLRWHEKVFLKHEMNGCVFHRPLRHDDLDALCFDLLPTIGDRQEGDAGSLHHQGLHGSHIV